MDYISTRGKTRPEPYFAVPTACTADRCKLGKEKERKAAAMWPSLWS